MKTKQVLRQLKNTSCFRYLKQILRSVWTWNPATARRNGVEEHPLLTKEKLHKALRHAAWVLRKMKIFCESESCMQGSFFRWIISIYQYLSPRITKPFRQMTQAYYTVNNQPISPCLCDSFATATLHSSHSAYQPPPGWSLLPQKKDRIVTLMTTMLGLLRDIVIYQVNRICLSDKPGVCFLRERLLKFESL